jgi:hypothetical protein
MAKSHGVCVNRECFCVLKNDKHYLFDHGVCITCMYVEAVHKEGVDVAVVRQRKERKRTTKTREMASHKCVIYVRRSRS